eukprot:scaffold7335_cov89-Isochrysis_galbana.AAC.4
MLARPWRVGTREVYIHLRLCGKNGRDRPSPSGIGTLYLCSRRRNPSLRNRIFSIPTAPCSLPLRFPSEVKPFLKQFQAMDVDGDGRVGRKDIEKMFQVSLTHPAAYLTQWTSAQPSSFCHDPPTHPPCSLPTLCGPPPTSPLVPAPPFFLVGEVSHPLVPCV